MRSEAESETVLPVDWLRSLMDRADLDQSYRDLEGCSHFHAETMRGRLRSLALQIDDASDHFRRALTGAADAPTSIPNQVRGLALHAYWFENCLLGAPLARTTPPPTFEVPRFSAKANENYPEIRFAINFRLCAEGLWRLHAGEWEASVRIYRDLIDTNRDAPGPIVAGYFLGLAASQHNLGQTLEARRSFENAGLFATLEGTTLSRLTIASGLLGAYSCLGDETTAEGWRAFLDRLECPRATKDAFLKRAGILVERWHSHTKLLPV